MKRERTSQARSTEMIVRIVTFEGLQPMVTEASTFMREIGECRLEVEDSNGNWKITILMIISFGFAAMTMEVFEDCSEALMNFLCNKVIEREIRMVEIEYRVHA